MTLLIGALTIGLILSLLALGVFISFKIFNFPDITADGSITFGAAIAASLIVAGVHPLIATLVAFAGGFLAGAVTGVLHTHFKINGLLAGILVMTALYSVNLHVMGRSNIPLLSKTTLITYIEDFSKFISPLNETTNIAGWSVPSQDLWVLLFMFLVILIIGVVLYLFFKTNIGTAMRATGNNQQMIRALGVNTKIMIILGLAISNGLIALSGAFLAQFQGFADVQMGIGMVVWGLASVIIGEALINVKSLGLIISGAVMGSILFRLLVAIALRWGMNPNDL
ncbi:MAG: ABC transporter permease, partial [Bacteroidales bacterium]|nr:ABC transporter permease [Bacteroidales bacterium]